MIAAGVKRGLAMLTILAIAGTLTSCGRYGPPVRAVPQNEPPGPEEIQGYPPFSETPLEPPLEPSSEPAESDEELEREDAREANR